MEKSDLLSAALRLVRTLRENGNTSPEGLVEEAFEGNTSPEGLVEEAFQVGAFQEAILSIADNKDNVVIEPRQCELICRLLFGSPDECSQYWQFNTDQIFLTHKKVNRLLPPLYRALKSGLNEGSFYHKFFPDDGEWELKLTNNHRDYYQLRTSDFPVQKLTFAHAFVMIDGMQITRMTASDAGAIRSLKHMADNLHKSVLERLQEKNTQSNMHLHFFICMDNKDGRRPLGKLLAQVGRFKEAGKTT